MPIIDIKKNNTKRRLNLKEKATDFCALDGEADTSNGHSYDLFSMGNDSDNPLIINGGIDFFDICEYLYEHYNHGTAYVGFFLGYDWNQWFKTLPMERAAMLLTTEGRAKRKPQRSANPTPFPVDYNNWEFDILGMKRFKLRPKSCACLKIKNQARCKCPQRDWMYINDAGGFFQTAFINVINPDKWAKGSCPVTDKEYQIILKGKERRSDAKLDDEMIEYNKLENEILERVMHLYDEGLRQIGVYLNYKEWFGPGQAAQKWMHNRAPIKEQIYGCTTLKCQRKHEHFEKIIPDWFLEAARFSYFGGWFEQFIHAIIPGFSYEYDINSAYPYIIANMPCLLHGKYTHGKDIPSEINGKFVNGIWQGDLCLVKAFVISPEDVKEYSYIGSMLHRNKAGGISRPKQTSGWYWYHELKAAIDAKCVSEWIEIYEWVRYEPCNCLPPMKEVENLYKLRLELGKNTPIGIACKLVYNSMYGKFAQSVGSPKYANSIYASLITAGCRTMILQAIASHPKGKSDVIMVATDAVYFLDEHPTISISDKLGEWDYQKHSNLTLWAPGFYWDDKTRQRISEHETPHFKARGVNAREFAPMIAYIDEQFKSWGEKMPDIVIKNEKGIFTPNDEWPNVNYKLPFSMTTCLQALMQNNWSKAGKVIQGADNKELFNTSNPYLKRRNGFYDSAYRVYRSEPWNTAPKSLTEEMEIGEDSKIFTCSMSKPYEKKFGLEDPFSEESKGRFGITQDGYVIDEFQNVLLDRR